MIGRWRNVHTDIGHDSIPSRISVYIYIYIRICTYIREYIYIYTKGRTMHVSNLIKSEFFENQSPPPPSLPAPPSPNGRIFRGTPRYIAPHPKAKEREIFTRELPCHTTRIALPRTVSLSRSPPPLPPPRERMRGCVVRLIFLRGHLFRLPGTGSRR